MPVSSTPRLDDFHDPELTRFAVDELGIPLEEWRRGHRKWWEWACVLAASRSHANLSPDSRVLGIASGHETPIYWFCNQARLVVATDVYGDGPFGQIESNSKMLIDPSCYAPIRYDHSALLVQRADARALPFGAETFDFAFSCSSVEHFGDDSEIIRAMKEAFRVLRPGGAYALAVDYMYREGSRKHKPRSRRRGIVGEFLTATEVSQLLVESAGFELAEPLDFEVEHESELVRLDGPDPNAHFPHLRLSIGDAEFTSLFMTLRKPEGARLPDLAPCPNLLGL